MVFHKDSALVQIWVRLVLQGVYKKENVPQLYNLQDVVYSVLDELEDDEKEVNLDV